MIQNHSEIIIKDLKAIIDQGKQQAAIQINSALVLVYWHVGKRINDDILQNQRAEYGKEIVATIAKVLSEQYGRSFQLRNLRRMMQFAEAFSNLEIVSPLATQLTWTHFVTLLPLKTNESRMFYAKQTIEGQWSKRELARQIERKAYERTTLANTQVIDSPQDQQFIFKDPYFLDFLGLKDGYLEHDLESAILKELEQFMLELGVGFTFVERQKRMIIDSQDFYLDLLFYHRKLKRLVAVELKIGKFKAAHKGQMELYLKWLDTYEKQEGEQSPIGMILCAEASKEQIELLQMNQDGILVAEYWTELPPKEILEKKLHEALIAAQERISSLQSISPL